MAQLVSRRAAIGAFAGIATAVRGRAASADPAAATVVGTEHLAIRSCPPASCDTVATAPLGARLVLPEGSGSGMVVGEPAIGAPVRVEYEGESGYAADLFLATDVTHVPYFLQGEPGCDRVALIFNVGVGEPPATGILDTLAELDVPATMFVMGWLAAENPPILHRMVDDGYVIGSHGDQPFELPTRSDDEVVRDVRDAKAAIEQAIGEPMAPLFTPYAAAIDERVRALVAAEGQLPVAWTVYTADYLPEATGESVYDRVVEAVHDGALVELHLDAVNSAGSTAIALPRIIRDLRAEGYRFVTVPEMMRPCGDGG